MLEFMTTQKETSGNILSTVFLCKIVGETKHGTKIDEIKSFAEAKTKMEIVFDHGKPVEDAFAMLRN